jgi:hypothetical protein
MPAWIFQANPTRFRLDEYLAARPAENEWLVSRYKDRVAPGDRVFIWRSGGNAHSPAGIIAEATVLSHVRDVMDDCPREWWTDPQDGLATRPRVRIALKRVARKREVIKRDWWLEDPVLRSHLIIRMANNTTFVLAGDYLRRLERLWAKTGSDWSYEDAVAGLQAFAETIGRPLSRLPGSVVANTAVLIGRAVPGIYNKIMNFRSLDPREPRKGLAGASIQDRNVWARFYSAGEGLRVQELALEYERLWRPAPTEAEPHLERQAIEAEAERLAASLSLADLWARYGQGRRDATRKPSVTVAPTKQFSRDALVAAIARSRARFRCEVPGCDIRLFLGADDKNFVEVHHIHTLATGGEDTPENVACLCPMHHREVHHGQAADAVTQALRRLRASEEPWATIGMGA